MAGEQLKQAAAEQKKIEIQTKKEAAAKLKAEKQKLKEAKQEEKVQKDRKRKEQEEAAAAQPGGKKKRTAVTKCSNCTEEQAAESDAPAWKGWLGCEGCCKWYCPNKSCQRVLKIHEPDCIKGKEAKG
jgi:hypothetical protein